MDPAARGAPEAEAGDVITLASNDGAATLDIALDATAPKADHPIVHARVALTIEGDLSASAEREVWIAIDALRSFADAVEAGDEAALESVSPGELRVAVGRDGVARATMHAEACAITAKLACGDRTALAASVRRVISQ